MRFNDIKLFEESELFEINMSPSSLEKLASKIDARAGMEFEMVVPNAMGGDDEGDFEPDYDHDERTRSWSNIEDFFTGGDGVNSPRTVQEAMQRIQDEFYEYANEQADEEFDEYAEDYVFDYVKNNAAEDEVRSELNLPDDHDIGRDEYEEFATKCVQDQNSYYDQARQEHLDDFIGNSDEENWLRRNYPMMSDIEDTTGLSWPYYTSGSDSDINVDAIGDEFSQAIGKPVNTSQSYHGGRREAGHYVIEPDGSIDADDPGEAGLEFVSPPLPIDEMFSDLDKIRTWAKRRGCYTNKSTGLHMNVSVPSWSGELRDLDYVKLALLLGDEYVLKSFDRMNNTYTQPAIAKVREQARQRPEDVAALLKQMKAHLNAAASKAIHTGVTSKYTSINTKDGYVEFRSPGGNWLADLQNDPAKIKNTLLRFVVALDAAADPEKYREEYLKKLYKLLGAKTQGADTVKFFADYVAGKMPKAALKSFIKQAQLERNIQRGPKGDVDYWWEVWRDGDVPNGPGVEVVAKTREEALMKAATEFRLISPEYMPAATAKPIRPYSKEPVKATVGEPSPAGQPGSIQYELYNRQTDTPYREFWAADDEMALEIGNRYRESMMANTGLQRHQLGLRRTAGQQPLPGEGPIGLSQTDIENRLGWGGQAADANYEIVERRTMRTVFKFIANTPEEAARKYTQVMDVFGLPHDTEDYGWRAINNQQREPAQQQRGGTFTGNWLILDPENNEIHRFGGIGNSQADANRVALNWLRRNQQYMSDGVTVVPEMR
jgi:hypothetical protein